MEIPISEDIRKFESKDIGNFSFRQAGFMAVAGLSGFLTYKYVTPSIEAALVPAIIVLVFGFFKPMGMSCWMFLRTFFYERALTPQTYIYENDFVFDEETLKMYQDEGVDISQEMYAIQAAVPEKIKRSKEDKARIVF